MLGHRLLSSNDYFAILKRRWWLIALPMLVLPVAAYLLSYTIPPQYISQTLVLIEQQKVPGDYVKPVITSELDERLASMKEQILSRSRIQPILDRFNLYPGKGMDERLDIARKSIDIKPIHSEISHSGGLPGFFISFKAGDARTAQQVCGEITSLFVGENLRVRQDSAQGTTNFLQGQLAEAKNNLDQQDAKLAEFQRKYIGKLPGEEGPNLNMLTSLNTQLEAATQALSRMEQDKTYQESILSQMSHDPGAGPAASTGTSMPDERQSQLALLQSQEADLSSRYTAEYPDVVQIRRKIADLKKEIARNPAGTTVSASGKPVESAGVQQLRAQLRASAQGIAAKRAEQASLQNAVRGYQERIQSSPLVEEQYKEITRGHQTAQQFYEDLLAKMNQSKMATDLERRQQGEHFTVMDEPNLPDAPATPKRPLFAGAGLALGVLLGLGITAFLEYRNTAIRSEGDVFAFLQMPTLATISLCADAPVRPATPAQDKGGRLAKLFGRKNDPGGAATALNARG